MDATAFGQLRVDVRARVAWLLRTTRLASPAGRDTVDFCARLRALGFCIAPPGLTRRELGQRRFEARLIGAYETLLGVPRGHLLGLCDDTRRTLQRGSESTAQVLPCGELQHELDRVCDVIRHGQPSGGDWLSLAHLMTEPGGTTLPTFLKEEWWYQLIDELSRATYGAWSSRFDAASRLMSYAPESPSMIRAVEQWVGEPGAPGTVDPLVLLSDAPTNDGFGATLRFLNGDDPRLHRGAGRAMLRMLSRGRVDRAGRGRVLVTTRRLAHANVDGSADLAVLLARRLSPEIEAETRAVVGRPNLRPTSFSEGDVPELRRYLAAGLEVSQLDGDLMLARLLREALTDDVVLYPLRFQSAMLLAASPYAPALGRTAAAIVRSSPSPKARRSAALLLVNVSRGLSADLLTPMLQDPDPWIRSAVLRGLAHGAGVPADVDLRPHLADPTTALAAGYAAGMSGHPDLLVGRSGRSFEAQQSAQWWRHAGARITELGRV